MVKMGAFETRKKLNVEFFLIRPWTRGTNNFSSHSGQSIMANCTEFDLGKRMFDIRQGCDALFKWFKM